MRKVLLSAIVIISFLSYAVSFRPKSVAETPVIAPRTLQANVSPLPTATPTSAPPSPLSTAIPISTKLSRPTATPRPVIPTATPKPNSPYRDGSYTGSAADAFYGNIQVQVTISGGRITNVQFLQYPNDRGTSIQINQQADPILAQEAIQAQSANVDIVSGATDSSAAFIQSMQSALNQAKS
jgi:uncharacterized protein with FMN-binding domain